MDKFNQYSKEWFAIHHNQSHIDSIKNMKDVYDNKKLNVGSLDKEIFKGSLNDASEKYQDILKPENFSILNDVQSYFIENMGGVEKIFNVLDENGDGIVTDEELEKAAAADSSVDAESVDTELSAQDLKIIYENAMKSEGAKVEINDNKYTFSYKDGTVEEFEFSDDGKILSKYKETPTANNERYGIVTTQNLSYEQIIDKNGQVRYKKEDLAGVLDDREISIEYDSEGNQKSITIETIGKIVHESYSDNKKSTVIERKYSSDGIIGDTKQKDIGDCWILASVNGLRDIPQGEKIIKDAIQHNDDGSVTVVLKGLNKSYTYSAEQIVLREYTNPSKEYAEGDIDMNLIEMAIADYRNEILNSVERVGEFALVEDNDPLNGGFAGETIRYLTGIPYSETSTPSDINKNLTKKLKHPDDYVMTVSFKEQKEGVSDEKIYAKHGYQIKKVDKKFVYVVNPHDSSKVIAYPIKDFKNNVSSITYTDIKQKY